MTITWYVFLLAAATLILAAAAFGAAFRTVSLVALGAAVFTLAMTLHAAGAI